MKLVKSIMKFFAEGFFPSQTDGDPQQHGDDKHEAPQRRVSDAQETVFRSQPAVLTDHEQLAAAEAGNGKVVVDCDDIIT